MSPCSKRNGDRDWEKLHSTASGKIEMPNTIPNLFNLGVRLNASFLSSWAFHLPILVSSTCFTSMQSCSSFTQGSSLCSAGDLGSGFGCGHPGHRTDGKKGSLNQHRFLHSPAAFSDMWSLDICLLPSRLGLLHQEPLTRSCCFGLFFVFYVKNKTQMRVRETLFFFVQGYFLLIYGRGMDWFCCEINALNEFHTYFETGIT